ncbi:MAG TPA: hypothetical protein VMV46_02285 [Thermoanaerobaculia bacterium]|nr:hypothetical protein [Thermoanaerobaculia bacterium]
MTPMRRPLASATLVLLLLPAIALAEIRLEPKILDDRDPITAVLLGEWRDGCVPRLRSVERDPSALGSTLLKRLTVRLDAEPVGACLAAVTPYRLEIPLGVLPSGRYALDVLVDDPSAGPDERYLDGAAFDVFAGEARERLALRDGRFVATVERAAVEGTAAGLVAGQRTPDSGLFWFFEPDNWEISVKLLDGCALNEHLWILAAATTDVPYRLAVDDRLTGQRYGVTHEGGEPSPAIIDVEAFACEAADGCGSGVAADIFASPRPDPDAERLAILLDGGVAAPTGTYERLARDLGEIRRQRPETRLIGLTTAYRFDQLTLILSAQGIADFAADGALVDAGCLNARYGASHVLPVNQGQAMLVTFEATLDMRQVALDYAELGSVEAALLSTGPLPQGPPQICAARDGALWLYYLRALSPVEPSPWFHFTSTPGEGVEEVGIFERGDPVPAWLEDAGECLADLGLE